MKKHFFASFFVVFLIYILIFPPQIHAKTCTTSCECGDCEWCSWGVCSGGAPCGGCGGGGGGCFTADTKIAMPSFDDAQDKGGDPSASFDNTQDKSSGQGKEIKDIKVGEKVKSFDPETGEIKEASVTAVHKRQVQSYRILKTEDGREIKVTDEHPFLVLNEKGEKVWKKAKDIQPGDIGFVLDEGENNQISNKQINKSISNDKLQIIKDFLGEVWEKIRGVVE